jgi:hypothetical protein
VSDADRGKALVSKWEDHVILKGPILEIHCGHAVFRALTEYFFRLREIEAQKAWLAETALVGQAKLIVEYDLDPRAWYLVDTDGKTVRTGEME